MAREDRRASDTSTVQDKSLPRMLRMFWITMRDISRMQDRRMQDAEHRNGRQDKADYTRHDRTRIPAFGRRHTFGASLRRRNALGHVTRDALYWNLQGKCQGPERVQNADTHFVRACAVKMHLHISQEQLYKKIRVKMPEPRMRTHTLCEPAQSKCTLAFHKSHSMKKFTGKMPGPRVSQERGHTFCEACAGEMHLDMS